MYMYTSVNQFEVEMGGLEGVQMIFSVTGHYQRCSTIGAIFAIIPFSTTTIDLSCTTVCQLEEGRAESLCMPLDDFQRQ